MIPNLRGESAAALPYANHIPTVLAGPMVRPGDITTRIDHYMLLRTLEDMYQLTPLANAATTPPITGIWAPVR